jgi:nucleoside-diphosphate-sugar epimerase
MHVAVIGGTNHVGPFIVRELVEAGHQVSVYNRGLTKADLPEEVERVVVDRKVRGQLGEALSKRKPDAVIDMVAFVVEDVEEVVRALPSLGHYVFCGSTVIYGIIGDTTPTETSPFKPDSGYGHGKVACEQFMLEQERENGLRFTSLRLAHPYGPGDHLLYLTGRESLFLDRMRKGRPVIIPGSGESRMHPIYAGDAGRAFVYALERPDCMGQMINLSGDQILTLDEYYESMARVLGVPLVARKIPNTWFRENKELWASWDRNFDFGFGWVLYESAFDVTALGDIGFRCKTDHDAGVALMMEWLDANDLVDPSSDDDEEDRIFKHL